jgi:hypothetical protein
MSRVKTTPELRDLLEAFKSEVFYAFNCVRVGIIQSFNSNDQTAEVQIVDKRVLSTTEGEKLVENSVLIKCPVMINKTAKGGLTIPINQNDTCLVLFNDRDIDGWWSDGLVQRPRTTRAHDLSDGIVLVGIRSLQNTIGDYNNAATELNYESTKVSLDDKVGINNASQDFRVIMNNLINVLLSLKCVDPDSGPIPIDGATSSGLSNFLSNFNNLFK